MRYNIKYQNSKLKSQKFGVPLGGTDNLNIANQYKSFEI